MLVARVDSLREVWVNAPSSLSGEDSCFVVMVKGVFLIGLLLVLIVV